MRVAAALAPAHTSDSAKVVGSSAHARGDIAESELQLGLSWLLKVRWGGVVGQLLAVGSARVVLNAELDYGSLLGVIGLVALSNLVLTRYGRAAAARWVVPAVLATDVLLLTALLALSGGVAN